MWSITKSKLWFLLALSIVAVLALTSCRSDKSNKFDPSLAAAVSTGDIEKVKSILEQGANPNLTDETHQPVITLITKAPVTARIHATTTRGSSQVISKHRNHREIVMLLVQYGAAVNVRSKDGWTPLMQAEASDETELVSFLRKAGATQ